MTTATAAPLSHDPELIARLKRDTVGTAREFLATLPAYDPACPVIAFLIAEIEVTRDIYQLPAARHAAPSADDLREAERRRDWPRPGKPARASAVAATTGTVYDDDPEPMFLPPGIEVPRGRRVVVVEPKVVNGHLIATPAECDCDKTTDRCPTCDWGLSVCQVCGAAEVELDKPCPGFRRAVDDDLARTVAALDAMEDDGEERRCELTGVPVSQCECRPWDGRVGDLADVVDVA